MTEAQNKTTRGFAKGLGLFLILFGIGVGMRATIMGALIPAFFQDGALVFVTAAFGLGIGCALVAAHHHFGSLAAIIITLFGWITLIRCAVLLVAPQLMSQLVSVAMQLPALPLIPAAIAVLIGIYLSFVGWFSNKAGS
jgi:hypothetical protein